MRKKQTKQVIFRCSPDFFEFLAQLSRNRKASKSNLIKTALTNYYGFVNPNQATLADLQELAGTLNESD